MTRRRFRAALPSRALCLALSTIVSLAACGGDGPTPPGDPGPPPPPADSPTGVIAWETTCCGSGGSHVWLMNADGSNPHRLTSAPDSVHEIDPAISPDGTRIAFASTLAGSYDLYVARIDGSGLTRLTSDPRGELAPSWSPDGQRLVFQRSGGNVGDHGLAFINVDGSGLAEMPNSGGFDTPAWSPAGTRLAVAANGISLVDLDGSHLTVLADASGSDGNPAWSPDGTRIAWGGVVDDQDVFVVNADGTGLANFTNTPAPSGEIQPAWSPDGKYLVFAGYRDGSTQIVLRKADGTGERVLKSIYYQNLHPSWGKAP